MVKDKNELLLHFKILSVPHTLVSAIQTNQLM